MSATAACRSQVRDTVACNGVPICKEQTSTTMFISTATRAKTTHRVITANGSPIDAAPIQIVTGLSRILCIREVHETETSRVTGAMINDHVDLLNFSVATENILEIFALSALRETENAENTRRLGMVASVFEASAASEVAASHEKKRRGALLERILNNGAEHPCIRVDSVSSNLAQSRAARPNR